MDYFNVCANINVIDHTSKLWFPATILFLFFTIRLFISKFESSTKEFFFLLIGNSRFLLKRQATLSSIGIEELFSFDRWLKMNVHYRLILKTQKEGSTYPTTDIVDSFAVDWRQSRNLSGSLDAVRPSSVMLLIYWILSLYYIMQVLPNVLLHISIFPISSIY